MIGALGLLLVGAMVAAIFVVAFQAYEFGRATVRSELAEMLETMPSEEQHLLVARLREARRRLDTRA